MVMTANSLGTGSNVATISLATVAKRQASAVDSAALLDTVLDLGRSAGDVAALYDGVHAAAADPEGGEFLTMLANMLKQGVVGRETLKVRGQRYDSFIDSRIAAPPEVAHARPYRGFDLRG